MDQSEEIGQKRVLIEDQAVISVGQGNQDKEGNPSEQTIKKIRRDEESDDEGNDDQQDSEEEEESDDASGDEVDMGEDSVDDSADEEMEDLVVDFEGVSPAEEDLGAVDALVGQLYRGLPVNTNQLSRMIICNDRLSTLLKDQDKEEPSTYGVASVLNLSQPAATGTTTELATEVRDWVRQGYLNHNKLSGEDALPEVLRKFEITTEKTPEVVFGLIVAEKVVNIPPPAMWMMLNTLREDILDDNIQFTHFLFMAKYYRVEDEVVPYEEYYQALSGAANFYMDYALPKDTDTIPHNGKAGVPFRRLFVIPAPSFYQTVTAMSS